MNLPQRLIAGGAAAALLLGAGVALADVMPPDDLNCDPAATYDNHGQYVSCVARNKNERANPPGNSDAAQSEIGK